MELITAEILTIGDEILYGHILDTNSKWISEELDTIGVKVVRKTTVGDNRKDMMAAFEAAKERTDITLITGGLGPTNDDLTKPLLAEFFGSELELHQESFLEVKHLFESKGRELTETNKQQAVLPVKCEPITNRLGSAPGMWFDEDGKAFVSMPGVPHEMKVMMAEQILPRIQERFHTPTIYHKIVKTIGIGESWLSDIIKGWENGLPEHISLAYLPSLGQVKLRLTATGEDEAQLEKEVDDQIELLKPLASKYIYGYNSDTLEQVVGRMLYDRNLTIATAESCTGGYIAHLLTSVPGSSRYFMGGSVSYDNAIKVSSLGVKKETIEKHGAVSEETVREMAEGTREKHNTDVGVATSGVAGPDGGSEEKPVGTVWVACATKNGTIAKKFQLSNERSLNIKGGSIVALNMVRIVLNSPQSEKK